MSTINVSDKPNSVYHKNTNGSKILLSFSKKVIVMGASSFVGASIARVLHQLTVPVIATEDNVNIGFEPLAWYRWEKLIGMEIAPQYMNYSNRDTTTSFIKQHSPMSIVYVPTPLMEGEGSKRDIRQITELHEDFILLLEIVKKVSPATNVILLSVTDPKDSYMSLIKLFELSLSVYNRLYGTRIAIIRTQGVYGPWQNNEEPSEGLSYCYIDDLAKEINNIISKPGNDLCRVIEYMPNKETGTSFEDGLSLTKEWLNKYNTHLSQQTKGIVASSYFTTKRNAQYSIEFINNNYYFMENWFKNIYKMNLNMAVFHDDLSDHFISTFKQNYNKADFIRVNNFGSLSPNDKRFYSYYDYILKNPDIDYFVMTDMRDLVIQNDPFEVMRETGNYIYVGIDEPTKHLPKYSYLPDLFLRCFPRHKLSYQKELSELGFFNAGAIGGSRSIILAFLTRFFQYLDLSSKRNCNMAVVEYTFHKHFYDDLVYGWPFNAAFLTHQPNVPGLAILHKWTIDSYN